MAQVFELSPTDCRKSFYNKAHVEVADDGTQTLWSYTTKVAKRLPSGEIIRLWDGWSATTGRHINAFCGMNKKEWMALEYKGEKTA